MHWCSCASSPDGFASRVRAIALGVALGAVTRQQCRSQRVRVGDQETGRRGGCRGARSARRVSGQPVHRACSGPGGASGESRARARGRLPRQPGHAQGIGPRSVPRGRPAAWPHRGGRSRRARAVSAGRHHAEQRRSARARLEARRLAAHRGRQHAACAARRRRAVRKRLRPAARRHGHRLGAMDLRAPRPLESHRSSAELPGVDVESFRARLQRRLPRPEHSAWR